MAARWRRACKATALAIFGRLAEAEGTVHGVAPESVTFHEVGAVDSIVDIVGTAIGLAALDVGRVYVSPLPLGAGLVHSQHGVIPVPGPATAELLKGFPVRVGDGDSELVTPTGAAIVAALARPGAADAVVRDRRGRLRRRHAHARRSAQPPARCCSDARADRRRATR